MSPSERLATLLRQRQHLAEHLAWLDTEIASASSGSAASELNTPAVRIASTPPSLSIAQPATPSPPAGPEFSGKLIEADPDALARANALADSVLESYRTQSADTPQATRRSCLLLTVAFALLCAAAVMGVYIFYNR
ncbi:MAG: hypothetical protein RIQ79_1213 [Verrucomicrobiota bacterium]|jgi:hypothetical protein